MTTKKRFSQVLTRSANMGELRLRAAFRSTCAWTTGRTWQCKTQARRALRLEDQRTPKVFEGSSSFAHKRLPQRGKVNYDEQRRWRLAVFASITQSARKTHTNLHTHTHINAQTQTHTQATHRVCGGRGTSCAWLLKLAVQAGISAKATPLAAPPVAGPSGPK